MQTARYDPWFYTAKCLMRPRAPSATSRLLSARKSYRLGQRAPSSASVRCTAASFHGSPSTASTSSAICIRVRAKQIFASHSALCNSGFGELEVSSQLMMTMENEVSAQVSADYLRPSNAPTHGDDRVRSRRYKRRD